MSARSSGARQLARLGNGADDVMEVPAFAGSLANSPAVIQQRVDRDASVNSVSLGEVRRDVILSYK